MDINLRDIPEYDHARASYQLASSLVRDDQEDTDEIRRKVGNVAYCAVRAVHCALRWAERPHYQVVVHRECHTRSWKSYFFETIGEVQDLLKEEKEGLSPGQMCAVRIMSVVHDYMSHKAVVIWLHGPEKAAT